jgi:hypothetical protein
VLNYRGGVNTPNAVHARLGPSQQLCVMASTTTDVLVDVTASYVPSGGSGLHALPGTRIAGTGASPLVAGSTLTVQVGGQGGVPASGVDLATVTVAATSASAKGFVTVWPCGQSMPIVSTLNFMPGDSVANSATLPLGTNGTVCVYSSVATGVVVDADGWWSSSGLKARLDLTRRAIDTRSGARPAAGSVVPVPLAATTPVGATAVVANVTAVSPDSAGSLSVSDCAATPDDPSVRHAAAENRAGAAIVALAADRSLCVQTVASAHVLVDVMVTF